MRLRRQQCAGIHAGVLYEVASSWYRTIQAEVAMYGHPLAGERVILFDRQGETLELSNSGIRAWRTATRMMSRLVRSAEAVAAVYSFVGPSWSSHTGDGEWALVEALWPTGELWEALGGQLHRGPDGALVDDPEVVHTVHETPNDWLWVALGGTTPSPTGETSSLVAGGTARDS